MPPPYKDAPNTIYIMSGSWSTPEESMCMKCFKPALREAKTYRLGVVKNGKLGVETFGHAKGCRDCKAWFYFDNTGFMYLTSIDGVEKRFTKNGD